MTEDSGNEKSLASAVTVLLVVLSLALAAWAALANDVWFGLHFGYFYCVADEAIGKLHASRWIAGVAAIVLVSIVRPRLARRLKGRSVRAAWGPALRIGIAVILAFVVTDLFLRRARSRRAAVLPPPAAPVFAHLPKEDVDVVTGPRKFHIALNKDRVRTRSVDDVPDPDAPSIVFLGESVAFGYGLDYDDTIPALVTAHTGIQTINLAINGMANDEALEWLKFALPQVTHHPIAVVSFVLYNYVSRNVAPHRTHLAVHPGGKLELEPPEEPSFLDRSPLYTALKTAVSYHDDRVIDLTREILRATDAYARSRGAFPLFVLTEAPVRCATEETRVVGRRIVDGAGVSSIRVLYDESLQNIADAHPNPRGAQLFAGAIERTLAEHGIVPPPTKGPSSP